MAQDPASGSAGGDLPEPVREWLADLAAESDLAEEELLARLLAEPEGSTADADSVAALQTRLDELEAVIDETDSILRGRLAEIEEEYEGKIEDVRERIIQVKRETDSKAHANHTHRELRTDIEAIQAEVGSLEDSLDALGEQVESTVGSIESEHDSLVEQTDELGRKLDLLARTVLEMRRETSEVSELGSRLAAVTGLAEAANRAGVRSAKCEGCGGTVDISLLTRPQCPHCQEPFNDFEPKGWFLGSNTLKTGTRPALEGEVADEADLSDLTGTRAGASSDEGGRVGADLRSIDGIGSSYADRLREAGIRSVPDLATADPDELADEIDVSTKLTADWVDQAREAVRSG